jgi:hypothetical protein
MKQLTGLEGFKNAFRTLSKRDRKIYNDLINELDRSVKKVHKSFKIKTGTKSDDDFKSESNRIIRFKNALKNLLQFEINNFTPEHREKFKKENWNLNLWCAFVDYPFKNYQLFFCCELFWIWEDYSHEFEYISAMIAKGYLKLNENN